MMKRSDRRLTLRVSFLSILALLQTFEGSSIAKTPDLAEVESTRAFLRWERPSYRNLAFDPFHNYPNHSAPYIDSPRVFYGPLGNRLINGYDLYFWKEARLPGQEYVVQSSSQTAESSFSYGIRCTWGYPFNRSYHMFSAWRILALASTTRARLASFKPGFEPMRTAWTTSNGCGGPTASSVRVAATKAVGAWAMAASCVRRVRHAVR